MTLKPTPLIFGAMLLGMAVGKLFESVASKQVDALCARAKQVYPLNQGLS